MSNSQAVLHLFLQLAAIIACCRVLGWLGQRWLAQPPVFMEMLTGVLLGPSLFGALAPEAQAWLFPRWLDVATTGGSVTMVHPNMTILYALAQVGLVLYMFVVGLEFDPRLLGGRHKAAFAVSMAGIITPFVGATALLGYLFGRGDLLTGSATPLVSWLFVGAAISITAFPMLARILNERGIASTSVGTLSLAAASIDDAAAWCLLAIALATFRATPAAAWVTIGGGLIYVVLLLSGGRRAFAMAGRAVDRRGTLTTSDFGLIMVALSLCAFISDGIGLHSVFGAFLCGAVAPKGKLSELLTQRIEQLTTSVFLPIYFVYSGLNTEVGSLGTLELWGVAALIITVATTCKGAACMLAARSSGEGWRVAAIIGTLMNTRGMTELILLNIALERGVITREFFTIMVLMALVTTGLTSPVCRLLSRGLVLEGATAVDETGSVSVMPARARA